MISRKQLQRAQHAQLIEEPAAGAVLSSFASIQRQLQHMHALPSRHEREHAAILIVRMRRRVHQACGVAQILDGLLQACRASVLRQRRYPVLPQRRRGKE